MDSWERRSRRSARLGELIHEEVSNMLAKGEIKDPRVGFVTVTAVKMTDDMQFCRLYVSVFGTDEQGELALRGLSRAASYVRSVLAKRLRVKKMPEIEFVRDASPDAAQRVDELLDSLRLESGSDDVEGDVERDEGAS